MGFMAYTNGTLIDEKTADRLAELANFSPAFSLEGWREQTDARRGAGTFDKVMQAMDLLRERGVLFGASVTVTRDNVELLFSDAFIDFLVEKGVVYEWSFHYIPVGRNPDVNLMLTPEQRAWLAARFPAAQGSRSGLPISGMTEKLSRAVLPEGGSIFISMLRVRWSRAPAHFAVDNIRGKSLKEVLQNPLFKAYQNASL